MIGSDLQARLRDLAGFRNLLVHDYVRVDPAQVRQALDQRAGDLAEFADAVEAWMNRKPSQAE